MLMGINKSHIEIRYYALYGWGTLFNSIRFHGYSFHPNEYRSIFSRWRLRVISLRFNILHYNLLAPFLL